ncbi:hypothetical protein [Actinomadura chokoriensis]|uniref:Uncharacterized protein n=1 Tax=Actinomadura chokoriensis TaxID=454156 RepID=A0ABV4QTQ8_9ACTN
MEASLKAVQAKRPGSAERAHLVFHARQALDRARTVVDFNKHRRGPTASHVTTAQMHVNSARTMWLKALPVEDLAPHLPDLFAVIKQHLPAGDTRRIAAEDVARNMEQARQANKDLKPSSHELRAVLEAVDAAREASLREKMRAVSFVRIVQWVTVLLFCLAIGIAVVGFIWQSAVPLCFTPTNGSQAGSVIVCPSRSRAVPSGAQAGPLVGRVATPADYAIVEIAGLTAASIAAATALRKVRGTSNGFGIPVALALLKLPTGALVAVLGLLLLRGQFLPGLSALDTSAQIIAWAIIFGYAQELFTKFVDRQGQAVLEGVRGTADPEPEREIAAPAASATTPTPPVPPVPPPSSDGARKTRFMPGMPGRH